MFYIYIDCTLYGSTFTVPLYLSVPSYLLGGGEGGDLKVVFSFKYFTNEISLL